ncbi:hypothetical protein NUACC21_52720 [Scytonema sp. NUACC21]
MLNNLYIHNKILLMSRQFFCQCIRRFSNLGYTSNKPLFLLSTIFIASAISGCVSQCDEKCINQKISEVREVLDDIKHKRERGQDKYNQDKREYDDYYEKLNSGLPSLGIKTHEELLRNCQSYFQLCLLLERTAILQRRLNLLKHTIDEADFKIATLEQNIWKLEKKLDLSDIVPPEEIKLINKLLVDTRVLIEEQVKPSESQDTGKLQKKIFENILNQNSSNSPIFNSPSIESVPTLTSEGEGV